jgi:alkanesulfonate monooxygenase SsuD/methylene tetrahydromethanopterin reductase-like flavin-dependent oxidoreductase (luciferase family)
VARGRRLKIAVMLQPGADGTAAGTREQARHAKRLGLDGLFVGDHLKPAGPYPESVVVLAAAAGVTEHIRLGVGTGGVIRGTEAWEAVGVPYAERGRRTDEALATWLVLTTIGDDWRAQWELIAQVVTLLD